MGLTRALATVRNETRGADPTQPWGSWYIPRNGELGFSASGVAVNDQSALALSTVASCIRLRVDSIASLTLQALRVKADGTTRDLNPAPLICTNPWPEGTLQDFLTQVMFSLDLRGNFFGQIVDRDEAGYATTIMPIHPDDVFAYRDSKTGTRTYKFRGHKIPTPDVVHIRSSLTPPGSFIGLNPVEYMRSSWGLAIAAEQFGGQFFANSAVPSGIISTENELSEDETLEWVRSWRAAHGGIGKAHLPAILTGGAKWQQITITPEQAQFLLTRVHQREDIISWFGIPPHKIGITDRTPGPTLTEELEMMFVTDTLVPVAKRIEETLTGLMRPNQKCAFDFSSRLRGNTLARMQASQIFLNTGMGFVDERREVEHLPPLPNGLGRVIQRPMNMTVVDIDTGLPVPGQTPDPSLSPANPGGLGDGGGDPNNSPPITKPDKLAP